jgi:hypothetical protein
VVVVVVVEPAVVAPSVAGAVVAPSVAGAVVASAAGAAIEVLSVVVVEVEVSEPAAGASTVVVSEVLDSHDDRPAVRARPRAATLNRLFILGVILKMG